MTGAETGSFASDWVSPPGDTILDLVEERGWTEADLAERLGYSRKHVNQLVRGKTSLSEDAALRLHLVLGGSVGFWLTREARFRERLAGTREAGRRGFAIRDRSGGSPAKLASIPASSSDGCSMKDSLRSTG